MAKEVRLICDVHSADGVRVEATETKQFSVGTHAYVVDVCDDDAAVFATDMERWTSIAERIVKKRTPKTSPARVSTPVAPRPAAPVTGDRAPWYRQRASDTYSERSAKKAYRQHVRRWAQQSTWPNLGTVGLVPDDAFAAFEAAHPDIEQEFRSKWEATR